MGTSADDKGEAELFSVGLVVGTELFHLLLGEMSEASGGLLRGGFSGEQSFADEVGMGIEKFEVGPFASRINDLDHGIVKGFGIGVGPTCGGFFCHPRRVFEDGAELFDKRGTRKGVEMGDRGFQKSVPGTIGHSGELFPDDEGLLPKKGDATGTTLGGGATQLFF